MANGPAPRRSWILVPRRPHMGTSCEYTCTHVSLDRGLGHCIGRPTRLELHCAETFRVGVGSRRTASWNSSVWFCAEERDRCPRLTEDTPRLGDEADECGGRRSSFRMIGSSTVLFFARCSKVGIGGGMRGEERDVTCFAKCGSSWWKWCHRSDDTCTRRRKKKP